MYKVIVEFTKKTEVFGIEVRQTISHVDEEHAMRWIAAMDVKIWNVKII